MKKNKLWMPSVRCGSLALKEYSKIMFSGSTLSFCFVELMFILLNFFFLIFGCARFILQRIGSFIDFFMNYNA